MSRRSLPAPRHISGDDLRSGSAIIAAFYRPHGREDMFEALKEIVLEPSWFFPEKPRLLLGFLEVYTLRFCC